MTLPIGTVIDEKYRIDAILGEGGMGVVAAATRVQLGSRVALKFLHAHLVADPSMVRRFMQEARAAAKLRSEHVCRIFDAATLADGTPYIVMELLDGEDLATVRKDKGSLDHTTACRQKL